MSKKESIKTRNPKLETRNFSTVGVSVNKIDALSLSTGRAQFTDDFSVPNTAHIKLLYSPHAHAKIISFDASEALKIPGVIDIIHHGNVPAILHTTAGQGYPEPSPYDTLMFDSTMRFVGDRVAAVLAETPEIAEAAVSRIKVEYEILPALLDFEKATDDNAPIIHPEKGKGYLIGAPYFPEKNIAAKILIDVGNLEQGLKESDLTFSETFYSHYGSHSALEPHAALSYLDERNRLVIVSTTQVPFHARRICSHLLQIPIRQIRVIKPRIGGGFGAKQEVFLDYIAGIFTLRTGRPAKIVLTREEVFISSRTRHPMRVTVQAGVQKDGTIHAIALNALMNTGAYGAHALTVLSNAGSKVLPLVNKAPHQRFNGITVYTNLPVAGAYRGYGATQGYFPFGQMMDIIARKLGIDVLDLYRKNAIRKGETSPIFQKLGEGKEGVEQIIESCGLDECIDRGAQEIGWKDKRNKKIRNGAKVRGVGMACMMQGSSIPRVDMGAAYIKMNEDGSFNLQIGATDIGTGSDTILGQIAAETLCVGIDDMLVTSSDTDFTPFDVGAYASSTTYLSGEAVRKCAVKINLQILSVAAEMSRMPVESLTMKEKKVFYPGGELSFQDICHYAMYTANQFQIQASESHFTTASPPPFAAHFAEVEIDTETGDIRVVKYVAAVDCGQPINPKLVEGQIEGAVVNGISWALTEEFLFNEKGKLTNPNFGRYKIFTAADLPDIKTIVVPTWEPTGPYGAKSVAEIGINGPAPAIANAIFDAIGVRFHSLPFTAEKIFQALKKSER